MCMSAAPSIQAAVAPPPPPKVPTPVDEGVSKAREDEKRKALLAQGRQSTLLTGSQGLVSEAPTQRKTLLGQ